MTGKNKKIIICQNETKKAGAYKSFVYCTYFSLI